MKTRIGMLLPLGMDSLMHTQFLWLTHRRNDLAHEYGGNVFKTVQESRGKYINVFRIVFNYLETLWEVVCLKQYNERLSKKVDNQRTELNGLKNNLSLGSAKPMALQHPTSKLAAMGERARVATTSATVARLSFISKLAIVCILDSLRAGVEETPL